MAYPKLVSKPGKPDRIVRNTAAEVGALFDGYLAAGEPQVVETPAEVPITIPPPTHTLSDDD